MSLLTKIQTNVKSENLVDFAEALTGKSGLLNRVHPKAFVTVNFLAHDKGKSPPGGW